MKTQHLIARVSCLMILLVSGSGCGTTTRTNTAIPPTETATLAPTLTPTPGNVSTSTLTTDPDQTWSTNFQGVTDLGAAGIKSNNPEEQLTIDATNVQSGGQSIKAAGQVDWQGPNHYLKISFPINGLIGRRSIDLSTKTLSIEVYVPSGSPVSKMDLSISSGNQYILVRSDMRSHEGQWYAFEADLMEDIALASWSTASNLTSPGLSNEDAIHVIQNVESITIGGGNFTSDESGASYFLVDRLGWKPSNPLAYDPSVDSLRKYAQARNLPVGAVLQSNAFGDAHYVRRLIQEFDTTLGVIGMPSTELPGDQFDVAALTNADTMYMGSVFTVEPLAEKYNFQIIRRAQTVDNIPDWVKAKSYAEVKPILENYIRAIVSYYKGKTPIWFLFNELLRYDVQFGGAMLKDRNQTPQTRENNYIPWVNSQSDLSLIEDAFRVAKQADPDTLLFVNDFANEEQGDRQADVFYDFVAQMKKDGTPIDGVGFQTHLFIDKTGGIHTVDADYPQMAFSSTEGFPKIAANVDRFAALGLKVAFTEVDVNIYTADIDSTPVGQQRLAERLQLQADVYRSLMHIALTHSNMAAFVCWDWMDPYAPAYVKGTPWWGFGDRGIFDGGYQPKPAYDAMLAELKGH